MAYYYYYQQSRASPESPRTTQLTPPPLLLLSPSPDQHLSLPLLTPILPSSVTTSMSVTTTAVVTEHHQQQLPTPNTFIKHCEDMGLFKDLQNVVIMSGQPGDTGTNPANVHTTTTTTTITTTTTATATIVSTSASTVQPTTCNLFGSSTAIVKTMMMSNPFDETFKQAVLRQQKADANSSRNIFNNSSSNNDNGELNTPFIVPTAVVDMPSNNNDNNLALTVTSTDMKTTAVVIDDIAANESGTTVHPQPEHGHMFFAASTAKATTIDGGLSVTTMEQQQRNLIVSMQHRRDNDIVFQQLVKPSTTTSVVDDTTLTIGRGEKDVENGHHIASDGENIIKQTLKQNLLMKQMLRTKQKQSLVSSNVSELGQRRPRNKTVEVVHAIVGNGSNSADNNDGRKDDNNENQLRKQLQKQELLERNRSAAKRCRIKRKQRWELLSEENRKLKVENVRLRDALRKLIKEQMQWTCQQQQPQVQFQEKKT